MVRRIYITEALVQYDEDNGLVLVSITYQCSNLDVSKKMMKRYNPIIRDCQLNNYLNAYALIQECMLYRSCL